MPSAATMGWTFYGLAEDAFLDYGDYYLNIDPAAYGYSAGEQVQGQLTLSGAALTAYLAALDGAGVGSVTLDAGSGVDFHLPVPRVGGLNEADFTPWAAPVLTLTSQGLDMPLADAQAFLFSEDDPDGPNFWMSQAGAGGFFFRDDDDVQAHLYGAWVPVGVTPQQLVGGDAGDTLLGGNELALLFGRGGDDSLLLQTAGYAWGGNGSDTLRGSGGSDWLYGGLADDVISGGGGADELHGEGGADRISGGSGDDIIHGDSIWQPGGNDRLSGNAGDDRLYGGWGDDRLRGGEGADLLDGGEGTDTADYSAAGSGVSVQLGLLSALVGDGEEAGDLLLSIENLSGSRFNDSLHGDQGDNRLIGGDGNDYLNGGGGTDRLYGGDGDDRLSGGTDSSHDYLRGGAGSDRFEFVLSEWVSLPIDDEGNTADFYSPLPIGLDAVLDFDPLADILVFTGSPMRLASLTFSDKQTASGESGTLITTNNPADSVFLLGVVSDQLTDANLQYIPA